MDAKEMYEDFCVSFPEAGQATDQRHAEFFGVEDDTPILWFESLAIVLNAQMGAQGKGPELAAIFKFFEEKYKSGSQEIRKTIDAGFVENLFWEVPPSRAEPVWASLPRVLQHLYLGFHGRPPI
nr:hypothetical protein [Amylibacter sp.]